MSDERTEYECPTCDVRTFVRAGHSGYSGHKQSCTERPVMVKGPEPQLMSDAVNAYARGGALVAEARGRAEEWHLVYGEPNYPENLTLALALADALEATHAFDALLSDKAIEAANAGTGTALEDHKPPRSAMHADKGTYQFWCSCGKWTVEMLDDNSYFGGLTPTTTDNMWARTKRAHRKHLIQAVGRAALEAAIAAVTEGDNDD